MYPFTQEVKCDPSLWIIILSWFISVQYFFVSNDCVATEEDNMMHMLNSFLKTKINLLINMTLIFLVIDMEKMLNFWMDASS